MLMTYYMWSILHQCHGTVNKCTLNNRKITEVYATFAASVHYPFKQIAVYTVVLFQYS